MHALLHPLACLAGKISEGLLFPLLQVGTIASDLPDAVAQERKAIAQVSMFLPVNCVFEYLSINTRQDNT